jgi:hypothetical protein
MGFAMLNLAADWLIGDLPLPADQVLTCFVSMRGLDSFPTIRI